MKDPASTPREARLVFREHPIQPMRDAPLERRGLQPRVPRLELADQRVQALQGLAGAKPILLEAPEIGP